MGAGETTPGEGSEWLAGMSEKAEYLRTWERGWRPQPSHLGAGGERRCTPDRTGTKSEAESFFSKTTAPLKKKGLFPIKRGL